MVQEQTNGSATALIKPHVVASDEALSLYEVRADDEEPRVRDIDLAVRLGMKSPRDIRRMIRTHIKKLNEINCVVSSTQKHAGNGSDFTEYYLVRKQATFLAIRSNTPASDDVAMELVEVYDRYRRGTLPQHPQAPALTTDASVAVLTQIRDAVCGLRGDQSAMLEALASLETRLERVEQQQTALPKPANAALEPPKERAPVYWRLAAWMRENGFKFEAFSDIGGPVGQRLRQRAKRDGVEIRRQHKNSGYYLWPDIFLEQHVDDIRQWLS